jgi:hypothetical protein
VFAAFFSATFFREPGFPLALADGDEPGLPLGLAVPDAVTDGVGPAEGLGPALADVLGVGEGLALVGDGLALVDDELGDGDGELLPRQRIPRMQVGLACGAAGAAAARCIPVTPNTTAARATGSTENATRRFISVPPLPCSVHRLVRSR